MDELPQGDQFPWIPPELLHQPSFWEKLREWLRRKPKPNDAPQVIDAEFEVLPPERVDLDWELTPDEKRQIRRWKGLE